MLSKLCWYFWQLFPCTYRTFYGDELGCIHFTVWKMWFGRCYRIDDVIVDTFTSTLDGTLRILDALCETTCGHLARYQSPPESLN